MTDINISIKEDTIKELAKLQEIYNVESIDALLKILIVQERKKFLDDFSKDFRTSLRENGLTLEVIIKSGEEIRTEILKEQGLL